MFFILLFIFLSLPDIDGSGKVCDEPGYYNEADPGNACIFNQCKDKAILKSFDCPTGMGVRPGYNGYGNPCTEKNPKCGQQDVDRFASILQQHVDSSSKWTPPRLQNGASQTQNKQNTQYSSSGIAPSNTGYSQQKTNNYPPVAYPKPPSAPVSVGYQMPANKNIGHHAKSYQNTRNTNWIPNNGGQGQNNHVSNAYGHTPSAPMYYNPPKKEYGFTASPYGQSTGYQQQNSNNKHQQTYYQQNSQSYSNDNQVGSFGGFGKGKGNFQSSGGSYGNQNYQQNQQQSSMNKPQYGYGSSGGSHGNANTYSPPQAPAHPPRYNPQPEKGGGRYMEKRPGRKPSFNNNNNNSYTHKQGYKRQMTNQYGYGKSKYKKNSGYKPRPRRRRKPYNRGSQNNLYKPRGYGYGKEDSGFSDRYEPIRPRNRYNGEMRRPPRPLGPMNQGYFNRPQYPKRPYRYKPKVKVIDVDFPVFPIVRTVETTTQGVPVIDAPIPLLLAEPQAVQAQAADLATVETTTAFTTTQATTPGNRARELNNILLGFTQPSKPAEEGNGTSYNSTRMATSGTDDKQTEQKNKMEKMEGAFIGAASEGTSKAPPLYQEAFNFGPQMPYRIEPDPFTKDEENDLSIVRSNMNFHNRRFVMVQPEPVTRRNDIFQMASTTETLVGDNDTK